MKKIIAILLSIFILGCSEKGTEPNNEELVKLNGVINRYKIKYEEQKKVIEQFKNANQGFVDNEARYVETVKAWRNAYETEADNTEEYKQAYNKVKEALILCNKSNESNESCCKERSQVVEKSHSTFLVLVLYGAVLGAGFFGRGLWNRWRGNRN
jgi:hypothetical protein